MVAAIGVTGRALVNLQVLNEYVGVILKRSATAARSKTFVRKVEQFAVWGQRSLHMQDLRIAWMVREALGFQWFDCLLLASASNDGCNVFLSEDMTDGARFGDLVIVNPFLHHPDEFLTSD